MITNVIDNLSGYKGLIRMILYSQYKFQSNTRETLRFTFIEFFCRIRKHCVWPNKPNLLESRKQLRIQDPARMMFETKKVLHFKVTARTMGIRKVRNLPMVYIMYIPSTSQRYTVDSFVISLCSWSFPIGRHRCRRVLSSFPASACPSACSSVCLFVRPEGRYHPNSLRISAVALKFGRWCTLSWCRSHFKMAMLGQFGGY